MKRRRRKTLSRFRLWLCAGAAVLIAAMVLPAVASAEPWENEDAMRESTYVPGRNTFIYDPGKGNFIPRKAFLQAPLFGYYKGRGFDANFLNWAHVRQIEPGDAKWAGCVESAHPEPCPVGYFEFHPVRHAIVSGPITVLYWHGAFIATACGNFSPGGGTGPIPRITGVKYEDLNGNGKRDSGEPGLAGWTIKLRHNGGVVATTTTAGNGSYSFKLDADQNSSIGAGSYRVEEVLKPGWVASQAPGAFKVPLGAEGKTYPGKDFGNYRPATIAGHKFDDSNVNGKRDPLESGLGDWTIPLSNGEQRLTDGEGAFSFSVRPGTYTVSELLKSGWRQTDPGGEGKRTYTVISGQVVENADFGNVCLGGVSISPVDDSTGEPVPMEVRLEEDTVPGILENEPSLPRTITGTPTFGELLPGTYRLVAFLPEGVFTTDPDVVPVEGRFAIVKEVSVQECETAEVPLHLFTASTPGLVTGGPTVALPGGIGTGGFEFMADSSETRGTLQYVDHVTELNLHSSEIEALYIDGEEAVVWGQVQVEGSPQQFLLRLVDAGEPGSDDRFELTLVDGYEAGHGETLSGGNIQIH
jgi:hypothetical protein